MSKKIMVFAFLLFVVKIQSQTPFNFLFRDSNAFITSEMLYETTTGFVSIGYYGLVNKIGIEIAKHDIKTGKILSRKQFTYKNDWIFTNERTRIYDIDHQLKFAVSGDDKIYQLNYDYVNDTIMLADTILNPFNKAFYIYDLEIKGDTTTYYAAIGDSLGWVTSYPNTPPVFTFVKSTKPRNAGEYFIRAENGNYIFFGGKNDFTKNRQRIAITEVDKTGNIIWEKENNINASSSIDDIQEVGNNEVLILASSSALDPVRGGKGFYHYIYKFNVKDKKFIWQKSYTSPVTSGTNYGQMVKSQRDEDTYFMVNTEYLDGSTIDSHVVAGHVTKFKGDGNAVWRKKYTYRTRHEDQNIFNTIIPTSDGNYLIGGELFIGWVDSWLVKIDEDGNILPIDTTSSTVNQDTSPAIPEIKVYPNPASHSIIINQGEITGMTYQLIDMTRTVIKTLPMPHAHHNTIWDISEVPVGNYIIIMRQDEKVIGTKQIVIIE